MENNINKNELFITGVVKDFKFLYEVKEQEFYEVTVEIPRRSENKDIIPVIVPDYLLFRSEDIDIGKYIAVNGEIRMKNRPRDSKHNIDAFGFALEYKIIDKETFDQIENKNLVNLTGFICSAPRSRVTSMTSRQVTDILIANNRKHKKSYYLPVVCWGHISAFASKLIIGDEIELEGRFQSRSYEKIDEDGNMIQYSVREISAISLELKEKEKSGADK